LIASPSNISGGAALGIPRFPGEESNLDYTPWDPTIPGVESNLDYLDLNFPNFKIIWTLLIY